MTTPDPQVIWLGICGIFGVLCFALGYSQRSIESFVSKRKTKSEPKPYNPAADC